MKKINYHNENYTAYYFNIIVVLLLTIFIIGWRISLKLGNDIEVDVFCNILILLFLTLLFYLVRECKKCKTKRNLNLFIIKNGNIIEGKIINIYDNKFIFEDNKVAHNVTAEVEYVINNEKKVIVVDGLEININTLKNYFNKKVNIYVYNNMNYVDIKN